MIDTNNYPPYFIEDVYLGAVMYQYKMDTVITVNVSVKIMKQYEKKFNL